MWGFPGGASGKEPACQCRRHKRRELDSWVRKIPCRRAWQPAFSVEILYSSSKLNYENETNNNDTSQRKSLFTFCYGHFQSWFFFALCVCVCVCVCKVIYFSVCIIKFRSQWTKYFNFMFENMPNRSSHVIRCSFVTLCLVAELFISLWCYTQKVFNLSLL